MEETVQFPVLEMEETVQFPVLEMEETVHFPALEMKETIQSPVLEMKETVQFPVLEMKETVQFPVLEMDEASGISLPQGSLKLQVAEVVVVAAAAPSDVPAPVRPDALLLVPQHPRQRLPLLPLLLVLLLPGPQALERQGV